MQLDPSIILSGRGTNPLAAMAAGQAAAQQQINNQQQNALAALYQQQGPGIAAGDPQAVNALARFDPAGAQDIMAQRQQMDLARQQAAQQAQAEAASLTAAEAAQHAVALEKAANAAAMASSPQEWDAAVTAAGAPELVGKFAQKWTVLGGILGVKDALDVKLKQNPEPPKPADDYQRYVQEQLAAGQKPLDRIAFEQAIKGNGVTTTTTNADGSSVTTTVGGKGAPQSPDKINIDPQGVQNAIDMIDAIASDKALGKITGPILGGGGNNVDELPWYQRGYYGSDGLSLVERIGQLQSTTWLAARQMLKGGGAITDYESRKAENAMARLSRVKNEADFKAALADLRSAIVEGKKKLDAAAGVTAQPAAPAQTSTAPGSMDFSRMGLAELGSVDVNTLTEEQMQALSDRLKELGH